ncbi:hypothetical protein BAUCODRAFT_222587 [Baudoinia panamericana UAMH 10762]|uniref:Uncharacterized protein n=1 Tax=Baudoinia panamericana (strain UAMH 10762) TaxID=717646 RepID=M2N5V6_BAUPA|nr:uncharacterized protein BAUCODRAFT_222587 [Baudoinia panamericana UAMH 10762]EMC94155.1 hypothetical protein BAUCODRAFT_222587 [Baudoinia panamericana UAMH 10762]
MLQNVDFGNLVNDAAVQVVAAARWLPLAFEMKYAYESLRRKAGYLRLMVRWYAAYWKPRRYRRARHQVTYRAPCRHSVRAQKCSGEPHLIFACRSASTDATFHVHNDRVPKCEVTKK